MRIQVPSPASGRVMMRIEVSFLPSATARDAYSMPVAHKRMSRDAHSCGFARERKGLNSLQRVRFRQLQVSGRRLGSVIRQDSKRRTFGQFGIR